jgi:hypothetical protein
MGNLTSSNKSGKWVESSKALDLHPSSRVFDERAIAEFPDDCEFYYPSCGKRQMRILPTHLLTVADLRTEFPKTYTLAKDLYNRKIAYVWDGNYSNTVDFDSCDNVTFCYRMPSSYTKLEDIFAKEFTETQESNREKYEKYQEELRKMRKQEEEEMKKSLLEHEKIIMNVVDDIVVIGAHN